MRSFKNYLKEEVMPTVLSNGSIDIANESVRDEINGYLSAIASRPCITPYVALNKMRKLLAYFHIYLPKRAYMEGKHGVEVWGINQFGDKMGMTDQGEFVKSVPAKFHLFFHYHLVGSHYFIDAKVVTDEELEDKVSTTEKMFAEGHDAACQQSMAKAIAPKEAIKHTDDGTESTEKAVATSQRKSNKKLSAGELDEASLGKLIRYKRGREDDIRATEISASHSEGMAKAHKGHDEKKSKAFGDEAKWLRGKQDSMRKGIALADKKMKGKARVNASMPKHPYMEETVEEGIMDTIRLGSEGKERVRRIAGGLSDRGGNWDFKKNDFTEKGKAQVKSRLKNVKGAADYALKEEELDETRMPASVIKHKQRIANMTPEEKAKKFAGKSDEQLKSMARRHGFGKDSNEYSKHGSFEKKQIDEVSKGKAIRAYAAAATHNYDDSHPKSDAIKGHIERKFGAKAGEHAEKAAYSSIFGRDYKSLNSDRLERAKPSSEMRKTKSGKIHKQDVESKKSEITHRRAMGKFDTKRGHLPEETISEKAPPGAKFERMVKHIKKGYSKGGLSAKEKSIAYATAWKAKKKETD